MVVFRFLDWLERAPAGARAEAVDPLVRAYFSADVAAEEREALDAALTLLLDDPSVDVRRNLAEALARQETAPRHLVVGLIQDLPAIAEPVLRRSPCLLDGELIEAVGAGTPRVQVAIASRPWVSHAVSEAIAADGERDAVLALIENQGSDLDEIAFRTIIARFTADGDIRESLFARPDLPLAARQSLIAGLGAKLSDLMVSRSWMPARRAATVVREACDKATVLIAADAGEEELMALVEHLRASGQLTTALLIRTICQGNIRFLEVALARLSGLPASRVYPILAEGRQGSLTALFQRAGLPARSHAAFQVALEVWRELDFDGAPGDRSRFSRRMIERMLTRYQNFDWSEVEDLIAMLRRLAAEAARDAARSYASRAHRGERPVHGERPEDIVAAA